MSKEKISRQEIRADKAICDAASVPITKKQLIRMPASERTAFVTDAWTKATSLSSEDH